MKKITLLAMSLVMALTVKAQGSEDVTHLLTNASFDAQTTAETTPVTGWAGEFQTQTASYENFTGTFAEKWCGSYKTGTGQVLEEDGKTYYLLSDFSCSQTIDVENGVYVLGAYVIANNQDLTRLNPVHGVLLCANEDTTSCTSGNGVPAWHQVTTVVTDGKLTVALRTQSTTANWVAWDGIVLTRYAGATVEEAKLAWVLDELNKLSETALTLADGTIQASLVEAINATVNAIGDVTTYDAGAALLATLQEQVAAAELSAEAYVHLVTALDAAANELGQGFTEGVEDFEAAVEVAQAVYDNATATVEEVEAAIAKLQEDLFTFQMLNADGTIAFDVTERFMTNPTMRKNAEGWSGSQPGLEYEVMEFYDCDFDMYQQLTDVPNGMYKVHVQGFYRTGGNDSGAAYQAGTENITAVLYANEASVPMLSLYKYPVSVMGVTNSQVLNDYVNMRVSTNEAFNLINPELDMPYYAENELTVFVSDGTLKIGLRNSGHSSTSWCAFRDFRLEYYGNFPGVVLANKIAEAQTWLDEHVDVLPEVAVAQLQDAMLYAEDYTYPDLDEEEVQAVMAVFEEEFASVKNVVAQLDELTKLLAKAEELVALEYPGVADFSAAYEAAAAIVDAGAGLAIPDDKTAEAYLQEVVATFNAAILAYYESQVASPENPADYTFKIVLPSFDGVKNYTIPEPWVVANVQASGDVWVGPGQPDAAGDGTTNLPCLNSWSNNFTTMDVHQDLEGLPNGVYSVSARAITQGLGQQHAYATSSVGTSVSEDMTIVGWDTYEWETLTTAKVVVIDGKLRIGFASVSAGDVNGWYQVTDFQLKYYGEASEEDLKGAWEASLERAEEMVNILLKGDSKGVQDAIAAASPLAAEGKYVDACQALNPSVAACDSVFNAVQKFYDGNYQSILDLAQSLDYAVNGASAQVLGFATITAGQLLAAEDATHTILDPLNEKLGGYLAYATYLVEAENTLATIKGVKDEHKAFVKDEVITPQVTDLVAQLRTADDCNDLLAKLQKAMKALEGTTYVNLPAGDLTEDLIANPTIDDSNATGWTVVKGTGNGPTNAGQHYDGDANNRYLDSWNGSSGTLNFTAYQEIVGLPDGTYELIVATRSDGDNAYVFAASEALAADTAAWAASTKWAMIKKYYADHGEIWLADSLAWKAADGAGEFPYFSANNGAGWGWSYDTITVEVTNHYLAIGVTANSALTGKESFNGTWIGADDWKLTLVTKAATQSDYNPFAGIENVEAIVPAQLGIYDLFGRRVETPTATGIYIVNGKKTFIKK